MDKKTINNYNYEAKKIAQIHSTLIPRRIYELIQENFISGGSSVDIGCGIGRDTNWLNQHGYPTIGIDASKEMLKQAIMRYPGNQFILDKLPELSNFSNSLFQNILCSAVLMHLDDKEFLAACTRILTLLDENGCLIISFRGTKEPDYREKGKLYQPIDILDFLQFLEKNNCKIELQETETEISRNLKWHNFVIKK